MNNLKPRGTREKCGRVAERRSDRRRVIKHPFGSAKWIEAVQVAYLSWPREDRRQQERRIFSRRKSERRSQLQAYRSRSRQQRTLDVPRRSQILTAEERNMLNDLNRRF